MQTPCVISIASRILRSRFWGFVTLLAVAACGGGGADGGTAPTLTINIESSSLEIGTNVQLSARNAAGVVVWTSSNTAVATVVSTGFVTAVGPGTATITASSGSQSASSTITVLAPPAISLANTSMAFTARAGAISPGAQTTAITNGGPGTLQGLAVAGITFASGQPAGWLTATLSSASATATQSSTLQLTASVAGLTPGAYTATVQISASGASNSPRMVAVTFTVTAPPTVQLSATTTAFAFVSGEANPSPSVINITSSVPAQATGLSSAIAFAESAQAGWLTATLTTTTTPATLTLQATPGARPTGTYNATVSVASVDAANSPRAITVVLTIAPPSRIDLNVAALAFGTAFGASNPAAQTVQITNGGGGVLSALTTTIQYTNGAGWLAATLNSASAPATLSVQPSVAGLAAGTYNASVRVAATGASNTPRDVAVTLIISGQPTIAAAPPSMAFTTTGPSPAAQVINVTNSGGGTLSGLSATTLYVGAAGWMTLTLNTSTAPATLTLQPNVTGLALGTYSATVNIASALAGNTPLAVPVTLTIAALPSITLSATTRAFAGVVGDPNPAAQTVDITNSGGGALTGLAANITYSFGAGWLTATLNTTTAPATLTIASFPSSLPIGNYSATVNVSSAVATNSPRPITVTLTIAGPSITLAANSATISRASGGGDATAVAVAITNGGAGTLAGLSASILNFTGPAPNTGWLTATLNTTVAPAIVSIVANAGTPGAPRTPGTYTATVRIGSSTAGITSRDITVTFTVLVSLANNLYSQIYPTYCSGCHFSGGSYPNLSNVTAFRNNMVNVVPTGSTITYPLAAVYNRVIVAGNASQSYLMYQLSKTAGAHPMPVSVGSTVPLTLRDLMALWITQGTNNN